MIDVAVIGAGAISSFHLDGYLAFPDRCRVVAVADTDVARARQRIEEYHLTDAVAFDGVDAVLASGTQHRPRLRLHPAVHPRRDRRPAARGRRQHAAREADGAVAGGVRRDPGRRRPRRRGPVGGRAEPVHQPDDAAQAGARLRAGGPGAARPGRLALVARPQLLRPVVARDLAERGRRLHAQPRRPPHRRAAVDGRNAGRDPVDDRQRRPRQLRGRGPVAGDHALPRRGARPDHRLGRAPRPGPADHLPDRAGQDRDAVDGVGAGAAAQRLPAARARHGDRAGTRRLLRGSPRARVRGPHRPDRRRADRARNPRRHPPRAGRRPRRPHHDRDHHRDLPGRDHRADGDAAAAADDPFRTKDGLLQAAPRFHQKNVSVGEFSSNEITT